MKTTEEGRAWFTGLIGLPAALTWIAYGAGWLLQPRFPELTPEACASSVAGFYYFIALLILFGGGFR
jgi:hypothetical protein